MLFTFTELFHAALMSSALGYIFMDMFKKKHSVDVVATYMQKKKSFDWNRFWFATGILAPPIFLHEMGHKFTAMAFGLSATFESSPVWLGFAVLLKLFHAPLLFFSPGHVNIVCITGNCGAGPIHYMLIALAGPLVHLLFYVTSLLVLKFGKNIDSKWHRILILTKKINLWLFVLNMIPIPGFDGYHVLMNLLTLF